MATTMSKNKIATPNMYCTFTYGRSGIWRISLVFAFFFGGGGFATLSSPTVYYNVCPSSRPIMPSWSEWKYMAQAHLIHIPPLGIWISSIKTESNWNYAIQDNPRDGRWVPMLETPRTILFLIFLWPDYLIVFQSLHISPNPFSKFVAILFCFVVSTMLQLDLFGCKWENVIWA